MMRSAERCPVPGCRSPATERDPYAGPLCGEHWIETYSRRWRFEEQAMDRELAGQLVAALAIRDSPVVPRKVRQWKKAYNFSPYAVEMTFEHPWTHEVTILTWERATAFGEWYSPEAHATIGEAVMQQAIDACERIYGRITVS